MYICSITEYKQDEKSCVYRLEMLELGDNGFNHNHELKFDFYISDNNKLDWEKEQVRHYFEYDKEKPNIVCNNMDVLKILYQNE